MIRVKYIFLLILPLLFSSCLRSPSVVIEHITTKLDKTIYGISENIVLSYTFDGYNGNKTFDGHTRFYGKTYGEIVLILEKRLPNDARNTEQKSFQVIDAGNLETRYEGDVFSACLFRNSKSMPLDGKIVLKIDEQGTYIMHVSCYIQEEGYNYDSTVLVLDNRSFTFTVQ